MRFVALLLLVIVVVVAVGCGGGAGNQTTASTQSIPGEETTARTTESTAGQKTTTGETVASSAQDSDASDAGKSILDCQLDEASKYNADPIKQGQFVDEVYQEAQKRGVDPEQVLYERGYDCGWSALQQSEGKR
ncbi:MAG: hypothetical protein JOZ19_02275 [Rubrobacter sp.]|nr:hypothetical protein [Rubrobacter sp.]